MRRQDVERLLSRVTYKPGSKITIVGPYLDSVREGPALMIRVEQPVKNVNPPYDWTSVAKTFHIANQDLHKMSEREFLERLYKEILDQEEHELREFFKVDGKFFIDPHPEQRALRRLEKWQEEALAFGSGRGRFPSFPFDDVFDKPPEPDPDRWKMFMPIAMPDPRSLVKYIGWDLASHPDAEEDDDDEKPETEG